MSKNVQTTLNFIPADLPVRTMNGTADFYGYASDKRVVTIHDARGHEDELSLSKSGFQYTTHTSAYIPLLDRTRIKTDLYAEIVDLLKTTNTKSLTPKPSYVKVASNTIRSSLSDLNSEYTGKPGPARTTHVDHTRSGATRYLYEKIPHEDASRLSQTRWAIINVWRPLKSIKRDPLAVCDGSTLQPGDLLPIQMDYSSNHRAKALGGEKGLKTTVGWEIAMAKYNTGQMWYYLSDMGIDDVLLMKIFDSDLVGGLDEGRVAVHASFEHPDTKDEEPRESIEFRCLVFWEDEPLKVSS
ncbi:hypothetical protein N7540_004153 [Penicillium herquei]|nr:hypothetical protein N7540_004153 [Penicillium herquei]